VSFGGTVFPILRLQAHRQLHKISILRPPRIKKQAHLFDLADAVSEQHSGVSSERSNRVQSDGRRRIQKDDLHSLLSFHQPFQDCDVPLVVSYGQSSSTSSTNFALIWARNRSICEHEAWHSFDGGGERTASTVATNPNGDADPIAGNVGDATKATLNILQVSLWIMAGSRLYADTKNQRVRVVDAGASQQWLAWWEGKEQRDVGLATRNMLKNPQGVDRRWRQQHIYR